MKLTQKERDALKASFRKMSLAGKADYIYTYFKLPIVVGLVILYFVCYTVYRQVTKKEVVLYSALTNISVGEDLESQLGEGFISAVGGEPKKAEVYLYRGLYISDNPSAEDHQYWYASRLKLMAAIEAKQLDVVLMNKEAYDVYSQDGYLLELDGLLSQEDSLYYYIEPYLTANTVVIEDNSIEYALNEAHRYQAVTAEVTNGIDVSTFPVFQEAGFPDSVYLGVIANTPRFPAVIQYIEYLAAGQSAEDGAADGLF